MKNINHNYKNERLVKFLKLKDHPWLKRSFKKLKPIDVEFCKWFLEDTKSENNNDYSMKVVRLYLDKADKPKAWKEIEELLISSI